VATHVPVISPCPKDLRGEAAPQLSRGRTRDLEERACDERTTLRAQPQRELDQAVSIARPSEHRLHPPLTEVARVLGSRFCGRLSAAFVAKGSFETTSLRHRRH